MTSQRFEGLDTLRVICSFSVVLLHVSGLASHSSSIDFLIKFRDFALPVMVLTSFFLLIVSLKNQKQKSFNDFFRQKVKRLWLPLMIWSAIYSLIIGFILPVIFGIELFGEFISPTTIVSGYRHLWYLQFLFISSIVIYPFIHYFFDTNKITPLKMSIFSFALTFIYGYFYYFSLKEKLVSETNINLDIFLSQTGNYLLYIPVAVGFGLLNDKIKYLFNTQFFRLVSLVIVLATMLIHLKTSVVPLTKELYGTAVFLAALYPWRKNPSQFWRILAAYSYGIYILHFFLVQMLWLFLTYQDININEAFVLILTVIIYFISFSLAYLIRKLLPFDFLLPLISIGSEPSIKTHFEEKNPILMNPELFQIHSQLREVTHKK